MQHKKGQAATTVVMVTGATITLFIAIMLMVSVFNVGMPTRTIAVTNEANETALTNNTMLAVPTSSSGYFTSMSVSTLQIFNTTDQIGSGNWTAYSNGSIYMNYANHSTMDMTNGTTNGTANWYFNYTYLGTEESAYNLVVSTENTTWTALQLLSIALIVMAAFFIMGYFSMGKKR